MTSELIAGNVIVVPVYSEDCINSPPSEGVERVISQPGSEAIPQVARRSTACRILITTD